MSSKKSKLDLLVRVRYSNPLPPPPFPPKLLNTPTHPSRYAKPEFTNALANETPLPMVVDAELGMPLDLSVFDSLWDPTMPNTDINPSTDENSLPHLDNADLALLADPLEKPAANGHGSQEGTPAPINVAWLRGKFATKEALGRGGSQHDIRVVDDAPVDVSHAAQIADIEATFSDDFSPIDLSTLKHPTKRGVHAVDTYDILPDSEIWANAYDVFKFSERPGERALDQVDPRLDCAVLRPMEAEGDHFLAYYLNKEDEEAETFIQHRLNRSSDIPVTSFQFVRDYETVKIDQETNTDFVFVLDDGDMPSPDDPRQVLRPKGAYYKNIERKIILRKRKQNKYETVAYSDKWDIIHLSHIDFDDEEKEEREEARAEVNDPEYLRRMVVAAEAEAQGEEDAEGERDAEKDGDRIEVDGD